MKYLLKLSLLPALALACTSVIAQTTAFTYQGRLDQAGQPYSGAVDMSFRLYTTGGSLLSTEQQAGVQVADGLFQVEVDFGVQNFSDRHLEIEINGQTLAPRQGISPAPLAIRSAIADRGASRFATGSNTAGGFNSTAMGLRTQANGNHSTAMGEETRANGFNSTAMGWGSLATGSTSTAMGAFSEAHGGASVAMGVGAKASAQNMVAIGRYNSPVGVTNSTAPDSPLFVAGNGLSDANRSFALRLLKNGNLRIAGTLTQNSDLSIKHDIAAIDPRIILQGVNQLDISSWRYNHSPDTRHIGPMAQDFHAIFGVGEDDTGISTIDSMGVALAAIQGVFQLTQAQTRQIEELNVALVEQRHQWVTQQRNQESRIAALEAILTECP